MMPTDTLALSKVCSVHNNGVHNGGNFEVSWFEVKPESEEQLLLLFQSQYGSKTTFYPGSFDSTCFESGWFEDSTAMSARAHIFVDFSALSSTREHVASDLVIACQTGIKLTDLNKQLQNFGQFFPVDGLGREARLIDLILSGDGGYLENGFGLLRSQVLGLEAVYGAGEILKTGGRVLKNVTGFDIGKLIIGSRGTLAFPYLAYLRLYALPEKTVNFCVSSINAAELLDVSARLLSSGLPLAALEIIEVDSSASVIGGNFGTTRSGTIYQLIVQVAGAQELVNEVAGQVTAALTAFKWQPLSEEEARRLLNKDSDSICVVEVAASLSLMRGLLESLISVQDRGHLRIRASSGRFYMYSSTSSASAADDQVLRYLDLVSGILIQCRERGDGSALADWESLVVSSQQGAYRFNSKRLGRSQPALEALLLRLKEKFDPAFALNPQASFN